jgi:hypothetical protein
VTQYTLVVLRGACALTFRVSYKDSSFLQGVNTYLPNYKASQLRIAHSSHTPPWKCQILTQLSNSHYFIIISPDFRLYDVVIASYHYSSTEYSSVINVCVCVCVCVKSELGNFVRYIYLIKETNLKKKLVKCYIWSIPLYGAETWTLRRGDQKYRSWRRMKKIRWTDRVRNKEVLCKSP